MSGPVSPGWYPDPSGAPGQRYWDGTNWGPVAAPSTGAYPPPKKRKIWPWVVIGIVILIFGGCATMCASVASEVSKSTESGGADSSRSTSNAASLGQEVRDGKFSFRVTDFGVAGSEAGLKPRGEFVIVTLQVSNIGNEPQSFFVQNQKLIDAEGREYAADTMAALRINEDAMALDLGPGFDISVNVPFDVPPGTQPQYVELHDSAFSAGALVELAR